MQSILATFFYAHQNQEAWWYKIKISTKVTIESTNDDLLPPDEAPGQHCLSKLLGITMNELWEVLLKCKLAKKSGELYRIDKQQIQQFIETNGLTDILVLGESNKQPVMRIGVARSDESAVNQWKS
jgi:hypothetical protein